jgi:COMPASS component SWD3
MFYSRVWDTATGQCLRTLVHEDNAPVTTVRFSPNGRYILAFTLDSCIRLWDYVSGTCKKTYQGHVNTKYSLGGAFGVGGTEGFIASGSEDGDILFWDVRNKEVVQRISGHEGVVCWVDTCPGPSGTIVSGGLDGTVRIWVDVNEDEEGVGGLNGLKIEQENGDDVDMDGVKVEPGDGDGVPGYDDTPRDDMSVIGEGIPERDVEEAAADEPTPDVMDED